MEKLFHIYKYGRILLSLQKRRFLESLYNEIFKRKEDISKWKKV